MKQDIELPCREAPFVAIVLPRARIRRGKAPDRESLWGFVLFALAWRSAPCRKFAGICGSHKFAKSEARIGKRAMQETGKSDAGNDKKQVRWRITNPEEAQTQGGAVEVLPRHGARMSQEERLSWKSGD